MVKTGVLSDFWMKRRFCLYRFLSRLVIFWSGTNLYDNDERKDENMSVSTTIKKFGLEQAFNYLYKDPEKNMRKLFSWAEKYAGKMYPHQLEQVKDAIENPENPYYRYIRHLIGDVDQEVLKTVAVNFFINENMIGWPKQQELKEKYNCNIPWTILLDPTSACNLHCTGCWAAEYGNKLNLSFDEIDDIIRQGKDMGVYMYIYTGGEPMICCGSKTSCLLFPWRALRNPLTAAVARACLTK